MIISRNCSVIRETIGYVHICSVSVRLKSSGGSILKIRPSHKTNPHKIAVPSASVFESPLKPSVHSSTDQQTLLPTRPANQESPIGRRAPGSNAVSSNDCSQLGGGISPLLSVRATYINNTAKVPCPKEKHSEVSPGRGMRREPSQLIDLGGLAIVHDPEVRENGIR
jgi:hypothetical protein